jgi:hypothetical protein
VEGARTLIAVFLLASQQKPVTSLGQIDLASKGFAIVRATNNRTDTFPHLRARTPIWPGDKVEIPANGAVKGFYDGHVLLLHGPAEWPAPTRGVFGAGTSSVSKRLLGRTDMGPPPNRADRLPARFTPLVSGPHPSSDFYIDATGTLRLAWLAPQRVRTVAIFVDVDGQTLGPYRYPAHPASSPDSRVGWAEDSALGTRLRRDFEQESAKVPITFRFQPGSGPGIKIDGYLVSRETARDLDELTAALTKDLSVPDPTVDTDWYESWNALLLETEDAEPSANAYWTVKVWSRLSAQCAAKAAMDELFASAGVTFQ